jgi:carboxyl-terminal processing protease
MKPLRTLAFVAALGGCYVFGFSWRDLQEGRAPSPRALNRLVGVKETPASSPEQVFRSSYQRILSNYVRPVKANDLKYAGMEGLMASLGDPHTVFMPPKAAQLFSEETSANFFGVGARLQADPLGARVAEAFEDGPAYKAGLREGNVITAVNGKTVGGMEIDAIVGMIKGPEGTLVKLTVAQKGKSKPVVLSIRRAQIVAPTVDSELLAESKVGYVRVNSFAEPTALQFDRELAKLEGKGIRGLVIDLRGNPGGLLETAVDMLSRFVSDKVVVKMRFKDGREEVARSYPNMIHRFEYPVVVLMNDESASAAEIFAGALKDYGKATLVGTHTYGKASVQSVFPLIDRSSAKITIARYYLPYTPFFGRKVDEYGSFVSGGLQPDVKVELDLTKDPIMGDMKTDNQLKRAVQVVTSK